MNKLCVNGYKCNRCFTLVIEIKHIIIESQIQCRHTSHPICQLAIRTARHSPAGFGPTNHFPPHQMISEVGGDE